MLISDIAFGVLVAVGITKNVRKFYTAPDVFI